MPRPHVIYQARPGSALEVDRRFYASLAPDRGNRKLVERFEIPRRSGRAWPVRAGQIFRIVALEGPQVADLNVGLFYVVAVSSLSTVGLIMAGWASNNKYALFGAMRSAAQIVSYEIPAVMILLGIVMMVGSLSLQDIVLFQEGGLTHWLLFRYFPIMPIAFVIFFTAGLAECNRTPFDIPEAESELVAGFHTEYSGFFFAMFFMAEYTEMFVISAVTSVLFLGGWHTPF